jgi:IS4 transposase
MICYRFSVVEETLNRMFAPEWLRETARDTELIKRERKVDPVLMFWVLTLSYGVRLQRTLAGLKRCYETAGKTELSYSGWYERFTPELVAFLKACVLHGIEHLGQETNRRLSTKLRRFEDLLIQDSTIIRLHEKLAKRWPAARTRKVAAGVKVSLLVSAVVDGPKRIAIFGERMSEVKTLRLGPWVRDRILLLDLGFYKHQVFARIKKNGGFFVSRLKGNADPFITGVHRQCRGRSIDVVGKQWSEVLPKLKREVLDVEV